MKNYEALPIDRLHHLYEWWDRVLGAKEIGNICFLPRTDSLMRVHQYIANRKNLSLINLAENMIEDGEELTEKLAEYKTTQNIVILAQTAFMSETAVSLCQALATNHILHASRGILIVHDNVKTEIVRCQNLPNIMLQQWQVYPLYSVSVTREFVAALCKRWKVKLDYENANMIAEYTGGVLWFAKDIIRSLRQNPKIEFEEYIRSDNFLEKVNIFWSALPESYINALTVKKADEEVRSEMEKYHIITPSTYELTSPVLNHWLNRINKQKLIVNEAQIEIDKRNITREFTKTERRVLNELYSNYKQVVLRDEVARAIWGDVSYSDWALDQTLSRLKKKIDNQNLPFKLETKKKRGYVIVDR